MVDSSERIDTIETLLIDLVKLSDEEINNGNFTQVTNHLCHKEEYVIYLLIKYLVQNYRSTGILKSYTRIELLKCFKWKETQLDYYLKYAEKQKVLDYENLKHSLNLDHILVKRVWNFYFNSKYSENLASSDIIELTSLIKMKMILEEEKQTMELHKGSKKELKENIMITEFIEVIRSTLDGMDCDPKDPLVNLCEKSLSELVLELQLLK
ncbi:MAG: hypothetical protein ACTSSK_14720 [Candidatus Heimdallarchaeota archaeon]